MCKMQFSGTWCDQVELAIMLCVIGLFSCLTRLCEQCMRSINKLKVSYDSMHSLFIGKFSK